MTGALRPPTVAIRPRTVEVLGRETWMQALARNFEQPNDTTQPGWRWSNDLRPLMGTDSQPIGATR
jgi:hypothetical protein